MGAAIGQMAVEEIPVGKKKYEVADIFREYRYAYQEKYNPPLFHRKVMTDIENCRTSFFGGHVLKCDTCKKEEIYYNSCCNRHCPKCQTLKKEKWLEDRKSELLPTGYFHIVFTLPHEINLLARYNGKEIYEILFKAVSETLLEFGANPERLGGKIGFLCILHTWDQLIKDHIHLHVIVPSGALSFDRTRWIKSKYENYLFPDPALSQKYRGKFIDFLKRLYSRNELQFPAKIENTENQVGFEKLIKDLWKHDWVVHSKEPFAGPEHVINYLGRYTHRVAISNNRILNIQNGKVTFKYRDRKDGDIEKTRTIDVFEFIRRFLLHVLPPRFMKIRYYGFLSNSIKADRIALCRLFINSPKKLPEKKEETPVEMMNRLTGVDITLCSHCKKGKLQYYKELIGRSGRRRMTFRPEVVWNTS